MQKKLIALAVAAALTSPALALADSPNVTFYGVLDADVESVHTDTPTPAAAPAGAASTSRNRVTSNASRLGLKGEENLGDGLTAIYQIETRVNLAGNETSTATDAAGTTAKTQTNLGIFDGVRNSNVGLKGDFGTAFIGVWDTPFKTSHNKVELFDNSSIATNTALLGSNSGKNAFNLRQSSSVQYWSPVMSGLQVKAAFSTANATVDVNGAVGSATSAANNFASPSLVSLSAAYDQNGIYAALATEQHNNFTVATATFNSKDTANRLVLAYSVDALQVGLTYETMSIDTNPAAGALTTKHNTFALSGKYAMGANSFGVSYTKAGDLSANGVTTANSGATQTSLRYGYAVSKRTEAYALYTQLTNKTAATYNFADVATLSSNQGAKLSGFGMGLRHTF